MTVLTDILDRLTEIQQEMRDRKINHNRSHSPTLIAWADRITAELTRLQASLAQRCESCDDTGDLVKPDGEWVGKCPHHGVSDNDIDLMRDVYMTLKQQAAYERILATAKGEG